MKTIGLCMIVKNEAAIIERCLDSVRPLIDFVLVEDTGSTDGTQQVIRDWLQRHHLPGRVFDEPWRDFASNRTRALEELRKNGAIDYALIMDADDFIVCDADLDAVKFKENLSHDQYSVELREANIRYERPQLCRNAVPYRYRGVLHEFLEGPPGSSWGKASGFHIESRREGARSRDPDKYRKDADLLERALLEESDGFLRARYMFYLGQSYRDCGDREKALAAFLARADMGFWDQEVYLSLYYSAQLQDALKYPFEQVFATYQRATKIVPGRAEACHGACRLCRIAGRNRDGYEVGKPGLALTPPGDGLFVETWIYDFGLLDEFSINAYWAGHYREALDAGLRLLGENKFPAHERGRLFGNARFAIDKLKSTDPSALDLLITPAGAAAPVQLQPTVPAAASGSATPPVSIITPTGNRAAFLAQALEHFRRQDYPHLEWLIFDDSPEPNRTFVELSEPNIRYRHYAGPRLTIGEKRNRLAELATGEIIVQFDDDDYYARHYVSQMVGALLENDADLINLRGWHLYDQRSGFYGYWDLMQKEGLHYRCGPAGVSIILLDSDNNQGFADNRLGFGFSYAFRKAVWEKFRFPHKDFNEDGELALQVAAHGKVYGIHDTTNSCLHLLHTNSSSRCYPQYRLPDFELALRFPGFVRDLPAQDAPPAEAAAAPSAPTLRPRRGTVTAPPVFIHASWRSSSTWFWSKFRELPETTAYFEPFGELNVTLTPKNVPPFDTTVWESRHPKTDSYLLEYLPLLRRPRGVRLYQESMAYEWFIPAGGLEGELRREEVRYLALLIRHAVRNGRIPVLGFVRSLGRVAAIKKSFDGVHILQLRNLWLQWQSYLSYKRQKNPTFYDTTPEIFSHVRDDAYLVAVRDRYLGGAKSADRGGPAGTRLLKALPEHDMFALFMALHVYLYVQAERCVDVVADVTRMAHEPDYWAATAQKLRGVCKLPVSFGDVRDERQPDDSKFAVDDVDWAAIHEHGHEAAAILAGGDDPKPLARRAEELIDAARSEATSARKRQTTGLGSKTQAAVPA